MRKNIIKSLIVTSCMGLALSVIGPSVLSVKAATEDIQKEEQVQQTEKIFDTLSAQELQALGLTEQEIQALLGASNPGIMLKDGVAYDKNGDQLLSRERGKLSWAVKALKKAYKKLPPRVKGYVDMVGLGGLIKFIEHYTGALEKGIYTYVYKKTKNKVISTLVSKTLMLLI